eukprot:349644-Chlamydomonas_euryale.AAC.5
MRIAPHGELAAMRIAPHGELAAMRIVLYGQLAAMRIVPHGELAVMRLVLYGQLAARRIVPHGELATESATYSARIPPSAALLSRAFTGQEELDLLPVQPGLFCVVLAAVIPAADAAERARALAQAAKPRRRAAAGDGGQPQLPAAHRAGEHGGEA